MVAGKSVQNRNTLRKYVSVIVNPHWKLSKWYGRLHLGPVCVLDDCVFKLNFGMIQKHSDSFCATICREVH